MKTSVRVAALAVGLLAFVLPALRSSEPLPPSSLPVIFVCGDSTAKSSGDIMGWGTPIADYFDAAKVTVNNVAHAGTSSRTYFETDWPKVLPQIKAGADIVASTIVSGLKAFRESPFTPLLSAKGRAVETADRKHALEAKP